jgi:hypothetical protein
MVDARADAINTQPTNETPQERRQRLADEFADAIEHRFPQLNNHTPEADSLDHIAQELY